MHELDCPHIDYGMCSYCKKIDSYEELICHITDKIKHIKFHLVLPGTPIDMELASILAMVEGLED